MITDVSLRLLDLIFDRLLSWLTPLGRVRRPKTASSSSCATRWWYLAEPTRAASPWVRAPNSPRTLGRHRAEHACRYGHRSPASSVSWNSAYLPAVDAPVRPPELAGAQPDLIGDLVGGQHGV